MKNKERKKRKRKKGWQYKENIMPRINKKSMIVAKQLRWGYPKENEFRSSSLWLNRGIKDRKERKDIRLIMWFNPRIDFKAQMG